MIIYYDKKVCKYSKDGSLSTLIVKEKFPKKLTEVLSNNRSQNNNTNFSKYCIY